MSARANYNYGKLGRGDEVGGDTLEGLLIHHWPTSGRSPVLSFLSNKEEEERALSKSTAATYFLAAFVVVLPYRTASAYWCPLVWSVASTSCSLSPTTTSKLLRKV